MSDDRWLSRAIDHAPRAWAELNRPPRAEIEQELRTRLAAEIEALPTPTWGFEAGHAWRESVLALVRGQAVDNR